jgi:hypothetical protein
MSLRFLTISEANDGSLSKEIGRDTHPADTSQLAARMNSAMRLPDTRQRRRAQLLHDLMRIVDWRTVA